MATTRCRRIRKIQIEARARRPVGRRWPRRSGRFLNGCGFYETINVDFVDQAGGGAVLGRRPLGRSGRAADVTRQGRQSAAPHAAGLAAGSPQDERQRQEPAVPRSTRSPTRSFPTGGETPCRWRGAKLGLVVDANFRLLARGRRGPGRQNINRNGDGGVRARRVAVGASGGPRAG